jgi:hypothetical protein
MKLIGFNADEKMKLMAQLLAARMGYPDTSSMMRAILEEKINTTFSQSERAQLMSLLAPTDTAEQAESPPSPQLKRRRPRNAA